MEGQSEMQNMLPLILLLMRDDSSSTSEIPKPSLDPVLQQKIDQINALTKLVAEMGLEKFAPIPTEWNIPSNGVSSEIITFLQDNPGKVQNLSQVLYPLSTWIHFKVG